MKKILFAGFMASILSVAGAYAVADDDGYLTTKSYVDDAAMWATRQADWSVTNPAVKGYIANKPTIPTTTSQLTNDSGFVTSASIPTQAQADWLESDEEAPSYIIGKPELAQVATSGEYSALLNKPTTLEGYGITDAATSAQGAKADTALQPSNVTSTYSSTSTAPVNGAAVAQALTSLDIPTSIADLGTCTGGTACVIDNNGNLVPVDTISTWTDLDL